MNADHRSAGGPTTWVVLCTRPDGSPFPEYIEGTELTIADGTITVRNELEIVRSYAAGVWLNYCEWVTSSGFFDGMVIRGSASTPTRLPSPRTAADGRPRPAVSPQRSALPETARPVRTGRSGMPVPRG